MNSKIYKAEERGAFDFGWLKTNYSFSFARWFDKNRMNFGALRVLNDDIIAAGKGFGTHPHNDMEIITIPLSGTLAHKDSAGHEEALRPGEVQVMSAGTGIYHSEYNFSSDDSTSVLQLWIFPDKEGREPRYDQKKFEIAKNGKPVNIAGPDSGNGALFINQDAWLYLMKSSAAGELKYNLNKPGNGLYLFVIEGSAVADGKKLGLRDAAGITDAGSVDIKYSENSYLLLIEAPMDGFYAG